MTNFDQLMGILTVPRPNGSRAERQTSLALQNWLRERGIPYRVHTFTHYPYFFECIGVFLILSRLLLALAIWLRWGWPALPIALLGLVGATVDQAFHIPLVTWPGRKRGENILVQFGPQDPKQELFISAHYDSKTELLDHNQRMFFLKSLPVGIALTLILGLLGPLDARLLAQASPWAAWTYWTGVALSLPLLFLALGLGLNMSLGRLVQPSPGAVDNGTACAILLGLAEGLAERSNTHREHAPDPGSVHRRGGQPARLARLCTRAGISTAERGSQPGGHGSGRRLRVLGAGRLHIQACAYL
jgi:hypothetical protein